jgi:hypothetical protein
MLQFPGHHSPIRQGLMPKGSINNLVSRGQEARDQRETTFGQYQSVGCKDEATPDLQNIRIEPQGTIVRTCCAKITQGFKGFRLGINDDRLLLLQRACTSSWSVVIQQTNIVLIRKVAFGSIIVLIAGRDISPSYVNSYRILVVVFCLEKGWP